MLFLKIVLILLLILIPMMGALYYWGIVTTRVACGLFIGDFSFPTHWEGKIQGTSGFLRRNFVVFKKYSALSIQVETDSGSLEFEVQGPDGSLLPPSAGTYGRDAAVLIDLGRLMRCSVALRMDRFCGSFHIALQ